MARDVCKVIFYSDDDQKQVKMIFFGSRHHDTNAVSRASVPSNLEDSFKTSLLHFKYSFQTPAYSILMDIQQVFHITQTNT